MAPSSGGPVAPAVPVPPRRIRTAGPRRPDRTCRTIRPDRADPARPAEEIHDRPGNTRRRRHRRGTHGGRPHPAAGPDRQRRPGRRRRRCRRRAARRRDRRLCRPHRSGRRAGLRGRQRGAYRFPGAGSRGAAAAAGAGARSAGALREAARPGRLLRAAGPAGRERPRPAAGAGRLHAPLRHRVRPAQGTARRGRTRTAADAALPAPQCRQSARLHRADDDQRLGGARDRRDPLAAGSADHGGDGAAPRLGRGARAAAGAVRDGRRGGGRCGDLRQLRLRLPGAVRGRVRGGQRPDRRRARHGDPGGRTLGRGDRPGLCGRFEDAYDREVLQWVDATRRGEVTGPSVWDGYTVAAVCEAGVRARSGGGRVPVTLTGQPALYR